jgi:phosphoribosyl-AMP cyclohydrolase
VMVCCSETGRETTQADRIRPFSSMGGNKELEEGSTLTLDWSKLEKVASKRCDVVPVVVQDSRSGDVLICAYVNETALAETFKQQVCCLWSTSRNELWVKGLTSGDTLDLDDVLINCEQNSLLFKVTPRRKGACHTKDAAGNTRVSCYYRRVKLSGDGASLMLNHCVPEICPECPPLSACQPTQTGKATIMTALAACAVGSLLTVAVLGRARR